MKVLNDIKRYIEKKSRYWYIVVSVFFVFVIANYGFLSMIIPLWVGNIITIVMVIFGTIYIAVMYNYIRIKCTNYIIRRKDVLFERIESLQVHIDELYEINNKLENKLAEVSLDSIDRNATKIITELSTIIEHVESNVKNSIQDLDDKFFKTLDNDLENIKKQISKGYSEQQKQVEDNTKALTNQLIEVGNKLEYKFVDVTSNLTDAVSEYHKEQMEKTTEFETDLDNWLIAQKELINETFALIEQKISESDLKSETQINELNSNISTLWQSIESETKNLVDVTSNNMSQIINLFEEQFERDSNNNSDIFNKLDEINVLISCTGNNTDNVVAEALDKIITNFDENWQAFEVKAIENRKNQEVAEKQINDKISESDKTTATLIAGVVKTLSGIQVTIGQDTDHIIKSVEDNTTIVIGEIKDKTTSDSKFFEELKEQISTTDKNVSLTAGEVRELITSTSENEIKELEDTKLKILSQVSQVVLDNTRTMTASELRIVSNIKEATTTISEISIEVSESISELIGNITENAEKSRIQNDVSLDTLRDKIEDVTLALNNGNIANIDRITQAESVISYVIEESKTTNANAEKRVLDEIASVATITSNKVDDMWNAVANGIKSLEGNVKNSAESIVVGGKANMATIINGIDKVMEAQYEAEYSHISQYKALEEKIGNLNVLLGEKIEDLSKKALVMQNELTKLMVQILDDLDDGSEKSQSTYDNIFNQISRFTNDSKTHIKILQDFVESNKQAIEEVAATSDSINNEQLNQTTALKYKVDTYSKVAENYQKDISIRLENLQNQVLNLNSLAEVLMNIYVTQKQVGPNATQVDQKTKEKKIDPNRIEEIRGDEPGVVVIKKYKNSKLLSIEKRSGTQKMYELEYDVQGRIKQSLNYGPKGDIKTGLQYYPNGQVKTRTETVTLNGQVQTVTSHFDEQGNKKK